MPGLKAVHIPDEVYELPIAGSRRGTWRQYRARGIRQLTVNGGVCADNRHCGAIVFQVLERLRNGTAKCCRRLRLPAGTAGNASSVVYHAVSGFGGP